MARKQESLGSQVPLEATPPRPDYSRKARLLKEPHLLTACLCWHSLCHTALHAAPEPHLAGGSKSI